MNYENATDKELELTLCRLLNVHNDDESFFENENLINCRPRYCTDWNATMPLAVDNGLDIELPTEILGGIGQITKYIEGDTDIMVDFVIGDNPLRAIVICLIKVLESK